MTGLSEPITALYSSHRLTNSCFLNSNIDLGKGENMQSNVLMIVCQVVNN